MLQMHNRNHQSQLLGRKKLILLLRDFIMVPFKTEYDVTAPTRKIFVSFKTIYRYGIK